MRVADASIVCDFVLGVQEVVDAVLQTAEDFADPLHSPSFMEIEALNALRAMERGRHLTSEQARHAQRRLARMRLVRCPAGPLSDRIWDLRHNLSAYDATYLALAERMPGSVLLTRDRGLAQAARATLGDARVQLV